VRNSPAGRLATLVAVFYPSLTLSVPTPMWIASLPFRRLFDRSLDLRLRDVICRKRSDTIFNSAKTVRVVLRSTFAKEENELFRCGFASELSTFWGDELAGDFSDQ
jgi:hypothetical protein